MGKRVFVVEDDHACETILRRTILSVDPDATIEWRESAEQAMLVLESEGAAGRPFDLIIADICLEGPGTGLDIWKSCFDRFPDTSVLMISSMPLPQFFAAVGREVISPPFLPKPFYPGECRQIIEGLLA